MKIVCDSCGAKYSIADEKVAGKVFKIRCKKCSAVIVVRGDQVGQEEQDQPTQVYDYGSDAVWHVVVDGDQQGPFAPPQIGEMLTAGTIDWEAYVWREGFDGWMAARDVPELVEAVTGQPQDQGADAAAAAAGAGAAAGGEAMGADPFAGQQQEQAGYDPQQAGYDPQQAGYDQQQAGYDQQGGYDQQQAGYDEQQPAEGGMFGAAGFGGEQEVASRATHDAGADLFAQSDAAQSPFGAGADDDVVASQPGPRVSAEQASMTGQRNENSVLFSLSNLQALATGSSSGSTPAPSPSPSSGAKPGHASGEGSGLIDIRALAGTASMGGGGQEEKANVDDLLSIGTGPSFGSSLGAPVLAPVQEEKSNKGLIIGIAAGSGVLAVAAIVVAVIFITKEPEPVAQASGAPNAAAAGAVVPGAGGGEDEAGGDEGSGSDEGATATDPDEGEQAADTGDEGDGADDTGDDEGSSGSGSSHHRRRSTHHRSGSSGSSGSSSSGSSSSGSSGGSSAMSSGSSGGGGGGGDIDSLLDRALGGMGGGSSRMRSRSSGGGGGGGGSDLPDTPPRDAVARALRSVAGAVSQCGHGQHGVANTTVTVSGSSGRVSNAQVTGQFAGTPVGSCVARAVRGARFPRFRRSSFQVSFPYRL